MRAAAFVVLLAGAAWFLTPDLPWLDDAYISIDSAQSLLAGGDAQYGAPALTGVTSPPYVLLLSILLGLGFGPLSALRVASALGLAMFALALWGLARSVGLRGWRQFVLPAAILSAGPVVQQATNGVETGWAMAVATALIAACLAKRPVAAAAAAGVLPWLRPDLLPLAGLVLLVALWAQPQAIRVRALAVAAIAFVPWGLWIYWDSVSWIPQTMAAKAAFFAEACHPLSMKLTAAGQGFAAWFRWLLPVSLLGALFVPVSWLGRVALAASLMTIAAYVIVLPGGLWHNYHRYLYPIGVPLLAMGLAVALGRREFVWRVASIVVVAASLLLWPTQRLPGSTEAAERLDAALWVRENIDSRAKLLVQDAGVFSVFTPNPLIDLVGLKTPGSIAAHEQWTLPSCGVDRPKALGAIARASGADYLIVSATWDAIFALTDGLQQEGVTLEHLRFPSNTPDDGYNVYRMTFPARSGDRADRARGSHADRRSSDRPGEGRLSPPASGARTAHHRAA